MIDRLDYCCDCGTKFVEDYDVDSLLQKLEELVYIVPVPSNWQTHTFEDWTEIEDGEELHWIVPSKEMLVYLLEDMCINCLWMKDGLHFGDIHVEYDKDNDLPVIDESSLDEQLSELHQMRIDWRYDHDVELPKKKYVGNCTKEFCERIVDKFWEREYERIQWIDFPPTSFLVSTLSKCKNEYKHLCENEGTKDQKSYSNIIKYFHQSIWKANVHSSLSPYNGWQAIKADPELFKDFYRNRLRCSDWFKKEGRLDYMLRGVVMENTYGIGLSTSRKYQVVTYFKPRLAKYIITKYLDQFDVVFDPMSGYSGRMIGALASGKSYIGQDLCKSSVDESNEIIKFLEPMMQQGQYAEVQCKDSTKEYGEYTCLFTCPPYNDIENWPGVKSVNWDCDKWIDLCITHYHCDRYVFVVDDKIQRYLPWVKESITNTSHFAANKEHIVVIDAEDLKEIHFEIDGQSVECDTKGRITELGEHLYDIMNQRLFNTVVDCPVYFNNWVSLIYKKFGFNDPIFRQISLDEVTLETNNLTVLLASSGGLDSTYQIFQLHDMGFKNVIMYHMANANIYENGQSLKAVKEIAKKTSCQLIIPELHNKFNCVYNKSWPENPIKNQMILMSMIDYCISNKINHICMDGSWEFSIDEVTAGIDVADAPENYKAFLEAIQHYVHNLKFVKTPHPSKLDKIKFLDSQHLMDSIYSCLNVGRMNKWRHDEAESKYNVKLFKNNCGCSCRKCAHHNLLMHYSGYKTFPDAFINRCWNIMTNNNFNSRNMLFDESKPLDERIHNLFVE